MILDTQKNANTDDPLDGHDKDLNQTAVMITRFNYRPKRSVKRKNHKWQDNKRIKIFTQKTSHLAANHPSVRI
jgi:hypothetical protein